MEYVNYVVENVDSIIGILTMVVTVATAIAALTKTPKDDGYALKARKLVDFLAFNFGNAKNETKEK
tara:strand:- start:62 stop:259 length:198 start_codon:yes stop_codon:yes gene_type:complete